MKAIIFGPDDNIIGIVPDSAIEPSRNPFFIPDAEDKYWFAPLYVGVRIDRLGKGISPKYADRYFSEVVSAVHPTKVGDDNVEWSRDGALLVGQAMPKDLYSLLSSEMSNYIALASEQMTLKTGDLVLRSTELDDLCVNNIQPGFNGKIDYPYFPPLTYKIR